MRFTFLYIVFVEVKLIKYCTVPRVIVDEVIANSDVCCGASSRSVPLIVFIVKPNN
jgi:hypothetical protein